MAAAVGARLNHVSRESPDIKRLAQFYTEVFGFEQVVAPKRPYDVIWLKLGSLYLHIIERDPSSTKPPECGAMSADNLPRSHHVCFSVSNFDYFVQTLKGLYFIVDGLGDETFEDGSDDDEDDQFESVCAVCDNGGEMIWAKEFKCTRSVNQMGRLSRHSSLIQTEMDWKLAVSIQSHEPGHYIRCSNIRRPGIMLSLKSEL